MSVEVAQPNQVIPWSFSKPIKACSPFWDEMEALNVTVNEQIVKKWMSNRT